MSLTVPPGLLDQARQGDVDDAAFTACIQASLPYAWQLISDLAAHLHGTSAGVLQTAPTTRYRPRTRAPAASCCG